MLIRVRVAGHGYGQLMRWYRPPAAAEFLVGIGLVRPIDLRRFVGHKMMEEMAI